MDDDDFKSAAPEMSRVLEITSFVPGESIDPRYFDTPYFMVPREGGDKAYALLRDALAEAERIGIGTFALRQKQHLAAVKPVGNALVLELMRFEAELVDPEKIKFPGASAHARPQEKKMAVQLIENLSEDFDPAKYKDVYSDKLRAIIKAKAKGKTIEVEEPEEREGTKVVDLMARLQASLDAAKKPAARKRTTRKKKTA
jgi:DNA end-binding protein Ku